MARHRQALRPSRCGVAAADGGRERSGRSAAHWSHHGSFDATRDSLLSRFHGYGHSVCRDAHERHGPHRPRRGGVMDPAAATTPLPVGFVRLAASMPLHNDADRVASLLDSGALWGDRLLTPATPIGLRRYAL